MVPTLLSRLFAVIFMRGVSMSFNWAFVSSTHRSAEPA
jgi:hypothetical protein